MLYKHAIHTPRQPVRQPVRKAQASHHARKPVIMAGCAPDAPAYRCARALCSFMRSGRWGMRRESSEATLGSIVGPVGI